MFGMGLSAMLPGNDLSLELNNLIPWPDLKLILLIFTMLGLSALGLHPVITVISVSAIFPPSSINIEPVVIALTYLGCWGLSTSISPFSGTTLFMSRVTGEPAHVVGWLWMPKMAVSGAIIVACSVILFRQLLN